MEVKLRGIGVSPGIAIGPAVTFQSEHIVPPRYPINDPACELSRYDSAVDRVRAALTALHTQATEELGEASADIIATHLEMVDDVSLRPEIEQRLEKGRVNVEFIVYTIIMGHVNMIRSVDDPQFRERATDLRDVGRRILSELLDQKLGSLEHLDHPSVVLAQDLTPSDTANMDVSNTLGLATEGGGPTSHTAILARQFEIPAVVGLRFSGLDVAAQDNVIIDGGTGVVVIHPSEETRAYYNEEKRRQDRQRLALIGAMSEGPCTTQDGHEISLMANIEFPNDAPRSADSNFKGIGLYRTEYLFMHRGNSLPTEEEQYEAYSNVIEKTSPHPVVIRTLDIGGDKLVPHLNDTDETNPQLGWRSIRFCLDRPDIFKAQLRAMFRASVHGNLWIMFPMISGVDVLLEARQVVDEVRADLQLRGVPFSPDVKVGTMIEVPAAVMVADQLAKECDFFSIGTNDLIQYCLAIDRVNERIARLYEPAHPAVISMLKKTLDAANKAEIPCSICGEMAGDPIFTELLLGLGFQSLSMASASALKVRAEIANTKMSTAKQFTRKVLRANSSSDLRALLLQRHASRGTMKLYDNDASK